MVNTIKKGVARTALVWAICLLAPALILSCKKESPTVSAADLVATATDTLIGYNYPRVMTVYPADFSTGVPTDTSYFIVFNIPVDSTDFEVTAGYSLDDNIRIATTSLGGLSEGADYTITTDGASTTWARIDFTSLIPDGDDVYVYIGMGTGGIHAFGSTTMLNNPGMRRFQVGSSPDTTDPFWTPGSRTPADGTSNVSLTPVIRVGITENNALDPNSINSNTFYVQRDDPAPNNYRVPITGYVIGGAAPNYTVTITLGSTLEPAIDYRVYLTTGVKDLSGNYLVAATNWTFTTTATPIDPFPGAPTLLPPTINRTGFNAAGDTAYINWTTSEATSYLQLHYGRGNDITLSDPGTPDESTFHGVSFSPPLTPGKRYWIGFNAGDFQDVAGTLNTVAYGPFEFNTPTIEVPTDIHGGVGPENESAINTISDRLTVNNSGIFLFYSQEVGANFDIYGQHYDSGLAALWTVPTPLFTAGETYSFQSAVEDEQGGVIVLVNIAGQGVYAKRINADGSFFDWGATANDASDEGLDVDNFGGSNDGTSASAVPVYTGQIVEVAEGTVEREAFAGNLFKDDWTAAWGDISDFTDADLQVNNYVLDTDSHVLRTVTAKPAVFRHMMQTDVAITSGNNYVIADHTVSEAITVNDHYVYTTPSTAVFDHQANGTNMFYTEHYTSAFLTLGDVVYNGVNGGIVTALNTVDFAGGLPYGYSGSLLQNSTITNYAGAAPWWIEDTTVADFSALAAIDDLVYNDTDDVSTFVIAPLLASSILNINDQASFDGSVPGPPYEAYKIYRGNYCLDHLETDALNQFYQITVNWNMGLVEPNPITIYDSYNNTATTLVSEASPYPNPLFDNEADFVASGVANGNIVIDFDGRQIAQVDGSVYAPRRHMLRMNGDIAGNGEEYGIIRFVDGVTTMGDIAAVGKATGAMAGHLVDSTVGAFAAVLEGDVVYNHTDNRYAMVTTVTANDLTLSRDALFGAGDRYIVFRQRGVLYIWEETGNIYCRTMSMKANAPQLRATTFLFAGKSPHAVPDGAGNAILVYVDAGNVIRARLLNSRGATVFGPIAVDTDHANMSILKVERDWDTGNEGGAVVLYTYGGLTNTAVQWVANNGGTLSVGTEQPLLWPSGGNTITGVATTNRDMYFDYNLGVPYAIVAYEQGGDILARAVGQISWGPFGISTVAGSTQQNPRVYVRGPDTFILWEDNRFLSNIGYGIFGMRVATASGIKDAGWRANSSGADDYNGVAVILNNYNENWPNLRMSQYNNGTSALLLWEDYRQPGENANVARYDFLLFSP